MVFVVGDWFSWVSSGGSSWRPAVFSVGAGADGVSHVQSTTAGEGASASSSRHAPLRRDSSRVALAPRSSSSAATAGSKLENSSGEANSGSGDALGDVTMTVVQSLVVEIVSMAASYALLFYGAKLFMKEMDPLKKQKDAAKESQQKLIDKLVANGRQPFEMNEYEMMVSGDLIYPEDIDVSFDMIGGLDKVKTEIFDIVALPLRRPDLFQGKSKLLRPPKGILLYGPPGTGKTMLAKAIARESGAAFINLQMSTTMNKWFGESQKLVRATFSLAWKLAPTVIFIDEIDSFLRERASDDHAAQGNMKAEFMALWDGLLTQDIPKGSLPYGVIVVGATNRPWDVDQAILRRMPRTFKLDLPTAEQRLDILQIYLRDEEMEESLLRDMRKLADRLGGYSGSDIKELCQAAAMFPFRDFARVCREESDFNNRSSLRKLSMKDFLRAMKDVKATGQAAYEYRDSTTTRHAGVPPLDPNTLFRLLGHLMQPSPQGETQNGNGNVEEVNDFD